MKNEAFKKAIKKHLDAYAIEDPFFGENYANPNKSIDDCITYIVETVQKSGSNGFPDADIYNMAIHYYDEKDIKVGDMPNCMVVTNEVVKLTPEEIETARTEAKDRIFKEEKERLTKKSKPKVETYNKIQVMGEEKPEVAKGPVQQSLF